MTRLSVRRTFGIVTLMLAICVSLFAAPSASADVLYPERCVRKDNAAYDCNVRLSTLDYYKGWGHTSGGIYCGGAHPSDDLIFVIEAPRVAWRWTSSGWRNATIPPNTQIYIWPFATGWSWVWRSGYGWYAMRDSDLVINPYCDNSIPRPLAPR
jgi:hypothetical protein